jgi:two-component system OmpR family response regulator
VLVVDDEPKMAALLARGLREEGMVVDVASTAADALDRAVENTHDLIVLDLMLPDGDGFEVCRRLRRGGTWAPVLMLTARDAVADRVAGLDAGADDYLVKPFSFEELLARGRAVARRGGEPRPALLRAGELSLDPAPMRVWRGAVEVPLSRLEFSLLHALMRTPGRVVTRERLLSQCWDDAYDQRSNVVEVVEPQLLPQAFERFAHGPASRGAGLGLAVVVEVARAHGGDAGLANRVGGGADAWIRLLRGARA